MAVAGTHKSERKKSSDEQRNRDTPEEIVEKFRTVLMITMLRGHGPGIPSSQFAKTAARKEHQKIYHKHCETCQAIPPFIVDFFL